jgi:four helix bundle protein
MHKFEDLKIWNKAMQLTENVYKLSSDFPIDEKYNLTNQIRKSAVSIPSNIAEGAGRNTNGEFRNFLGIANGSSYELITQLYLAERLNISKSEIVQPIINDVVEVCKMNYALQKSLQ